MNKLNLHMEAYPGCLYWPQRGEGSPEEHKTNRCISTDTAASQRHVFKCYILATNISNFLQKYIIGNTKQNKTKYPQTFSKKHPIPSKQQKNKIKKAQLTYSPHDATHQLRKKGGKRVAFQQRLPWKRAIRTWHFTLQNMQCWCMKAK